MKAKWLVIAAFAAAVLPAQQDSATARAHREKGAVLLDRRDFAGAAAEFRKAVEQDPRDFGLRYNLALSLANAGRRPEGIAELRRALRQKPGWGQGFFGLGHIYVLDGQPEHAEQSFRTALSLDASLVRARFELGKLLEQKGDRDGAMEQYEQAVRLAPDFTAARYRLGVLLSQTGQAQRGAAELEVVTRIREQRAKGEQAALAYKQGLSQLEAKQFEAAAGELEQSLALRPDFIEVRIALAETCEQWGLALEGQDKKPEAIEKFRRALEADPRADTYNHVGVLLARSGRLREAIASFRAALALQPDFHNAQVNLGQALALERDLATRPH